MTLIVAALPEEAAPLLQRLFPEDVAAAATQSARGAGGRAVRGRLAGRDVAVAVTGDGAAAAGGAGRRLLGALRVERMVVIGMAGALTPDLSPGALVVATEVRPPEAPDRPGWTARPELVEAAVREAGAVPALAVGSPGLVGTPARKAELARRSGVAAGGRAVVDLESAAYVGAAGEAGVPWVVLRTVSDTAAEALPDFLEGCRDGEGCTDRRAILRQALQHPGSLPALVRLARRSASGAIRLADACERLLAATPPSVPARAAAAEARATVRAGGLPGGLPG